jgi:four helix bundle protein
LLFVVGFLPFAFQNQEKGMNAKPYNLSERTFQFAEAILDWVEKCPRNLMTVELLRQLIKAGTSVGANTEEGEEGQSPKDEAAKLGIALKEVCESRYFLHFHP